MENRIKTFDEFVNEQKLTLTDSLKQQVEKLPESGMGYHKVNVTLKNGEVLKDLTVLNSSMLVINNDINVDDIKEIKNK